MEIDGSFKTLDLFEEVEISIDIDACLNESLEVDALKFDVGLILLILEWHRGAKVDVWSLDGVEVERGGLELLQIVIFREHFHLIIKI